MSGSQPATGGELHPLHRKALRHPLILDGLFRLRAFGVSSRQARLGTDARAPELCLHVLSSFQRTGRSLLAIGLLTLRSPPRLSPSGEPSNLTRRFRFVSTPSRHLVSFFSARHVAPGEARRRRTAGVANLKDYVRGKKICSGWTLANRPTTLVGSHSVHSIYALHRTVSTFHVTQIHRIVAPELQTSPPLTHGVN